MTFEQFAYYVAWQVKKMKGDCNLHWKPFYLRCPYCDNKYDYFIGRMETFTRDVNHVLKICNLTHLLSINSDGAGYTKMATSKTKPIKLSNKKSLIIPPRRTIEYFKNLNKTLIQDLLRLYGPDFKMFQYSEEEFTVI